MGQHPYWAVLWLILPTTSLSMSRARLWAQIFPTKILPPILFLNQNKTKQKPTTKKPNQFPKRSIQPLSSDTQIAWHIHLIFCLDCWAGWLAGHIWKERDKPAVRAWICKRCWWQGALAVGSSLTAAFSPSWRLQLLGDGTWASPWARRSPAGAGSALWADNAISWVSQCAALGDLSRENN